MLKMGCGSQKIAMIIAMAAWGLSLMLAEAAGPQEKLHPLLVKQLATLQEGSQVKVGIWLKADTPPARDRFSRAEDAGELERIRRGYEHISAPLVTALKQGGYSPRYISQYAPLVFVSLPYHEVMNVAARDDVVALYPSITYEPEGTTGPELISAGSTIDASIVWNAGFNGAGVTVAVVEGDGVLFSNPNLGCGSYYNPAAPNVDDHATAVAGIIRSTHPTYRGIAWGANCILSGQGGWSDAAVIGSTEWAISQGATVINYSFGSDTNLVPVALDFYVDHVVRAHGVTMIKSAGNRGSDDGDVTSPGLAWNILTVGAFDDAGTGNWGDDLGVSSYSSWRNPVSTHSDREKPEVVAPVGDFSPPGSGSQMYSTTRTDPWVGAVGQGTSYAAPVVAGMAAVLQQMDPALKIWPETLAALIMAGALHNLEGSARLSEFDGAGGVWLLASAYIVAIQKIYGHFIWPAAGPPSLEASVFLPAGTLVRTVIRWNSNPTGGPHPPTADALATDFDLSLIGPGGTVAASQSSDNNYEIIHTTIPVSGVYTFRLTRFSGGAIDEPFGFAFLLIF